MISLIRQQVLEILANETQAGILSDKLFSPQGLFAQVATTPEQRSAVIRDPLFRQAMARFMELQRSEAVKFEEEVRRLPSVTGPETPKDIEPAPST